MLLEEQDSVAESLGDHDADVLMGRVAAASRTIAYLSDETWRHIDRDLADELSVEIDVAGLSLVDNELVIVGDPSADPLLVLRGSYGYAFGFTPSKTIIAAFGRTAE